MNIQMQLGGIFLLLLFLYFYKRRKTLSLYSGRLFLRALYITIICLFLDILSIVMIVNRDMFPLWLVKAECKTYLVSLMAHGYMALIYANADIRGLARADRYTYGLTAAFAVFVILIYALPINLYCENDEVYTYGLACYATYAGALALVIITTARLLIHRKTMNALRRRAIMLWLAIWVAAAFTQFLMQSMLLVGFAGALGMVILFHELENPEIYIDRSTGFYNSYALVEFIKQQYRLGKSCHGILVSLENIRKGSIPLGKTEDVMGEVAEFIRQLPETTVFKTDDREFSLSFESPEALERVKEIIFARFKESWLKDGDSYAAPVFLHPYFLVIPSSDAADSPEEMLDFLRYFRLQCMEASENGAMTLDKVTVAGKKQREEMLAVILDAIKNDRIEVFFQPIYSTSEKKFVSAEALARIRSEDGEIIPPALFIPIAEETGLIAKIGETVFDKTCKFIRENDIGRLGIEYIEVNLSVVQCEDEELADKYIKIMERHGLAPQHINLEITESAAIAKKSVLLENMHKLISYGVTFSLDDFGNGQSNLNYIVDMPVNIVKFDHYMTQSYFETDKARFVIKAAARMIHDMSLKIVSEGVETEEQLNVLERLGIDYIQGYYFAKPMEGASFLEFLKNHI